MAIPPESESLSMNVPRRVGLWLIGAHGGVGSTTALGLAALARGQILPTGMVTALPEFAHVIFDEPAAFVIGGHELRPTTFAESIAELKSRSNIFSEAVIAATAEQLSEWDANICPARTNDGPALAAVDAMAADIRAFQRQYDLAAIVVINVASTEPVCDSTAYPTEALAFESWLERSGTTVPASTLAAWAAVRAGCAYVNLTPSLGGRFAAFEDHCRRYGIPHGGQDAKTGETLLKSVLAPMFRMRNLRVLSWVGHNILGNRDGQVLSDPANKASKLRTKDALLAEMLGYRPQSHVSIEYIESLDDWKTAWDHIHFEGFLGVKMTLQLTWQGCDSALAAPLVIDLARLALLARQRGHIGAIPALACFFKSPIGTTVHELSQQYEMLCEYVLRVDL
jgi:myo-inositol-1-phosphate synthase